jgi:hypothetical protein
LKTRGLNVRGFFLLGAPGRARGAEAPFGCMWCAANHLEVKVLYRPDRGNC